MIFSWSLSRCRQFLIDCSGLVLCVAITPNDIFLVALQVSTILSITSLCPNGNGASSFLQSPINRNLLPTSKQKSISVGETSPSCNPSNITGCLNLFSYKIGLFKNFPFEDAPLSDYNYIFDISVDYYV
jgi:hypothetical protein